MKDSISQPGAGLNRSADDKLDAHNRQQLSALFDGELEDDPARFLLRRLQHDPELAACQERWQLLGDVLRGQACAPAPQDFASRVAAAVASEPLPAAATVPRRRSGWRAWGGGALAASVAAVALFMGRQSIDDAAPEAAAPMQVVASQAQLPPPPTADAAVSESPAVLSAGAPAVAVAAAAAGRRQEAQQRRASATRTQQAARASQRADEPLRAVAGQAPLVPTVPAAGQQAMPFGDVGALQSRPWPRSSLGPAAGNALNASAPAGAPGAFYPFEPRLQDDLPVQRPQD